MRLVYYSPVLNHHQISLADEFYSLLGDGFRFVATIPSSASDMKGGEDYSLSRPYCVRAASGFREEALRLSREADVAVFGGASLEYALERARAHGGLSFEASERWLKKGWRNLLSPRLLKWQWYYHTLFARQPFYKLCYGGFAAEDDWRLHSYRGRCFKWGYFIDTEDIDIDKVLEKKKGRERIEILWCSRVISLKHPEMPIYLSKRLRDGGFSFHLTMVGDGPELLRTKALAQSLSLKDYISFTGNKSTSEVQSLMREIDIFLFTSNRLEGWGAVINEAMGNGCAVVCSDSVGASTYLIDENKTGRKFDSCNPDSLYGAVKGLIEDSCLRLGMASNAYWKIKNVWSGRNAARRFLELVENLKEGSGSPFESGPCSPALPL